MYAFLLNVWVFGSPDMLTEKRLMNYVAKGFITLEEAQQIMATPRQGGY